MEKHGSRDWHAARRAERAGYIDFAQSSHVPNDLRRAIQELAPSCRQVDTVAVFDGRATYGLIKAWWLRRRRMPQWAAELLHQKLEKRHRDMVAPLIRIKENAR